MKPIADVPVTRYARSGGLDIAYQVLGEGAADLVFAGGWVTHLEYAWHQPRIAEFYRRLASFSRLILFSRTVRDLVAGSGIAFESRGSHVLKGVPGGGSSHGPCLRRPSGIR